MKTGKPISIPPLTPCSRLPAMKKLGLDKLYELCEIAREELTNGGYNGRVIARPLSATKP